MHFPSLLFVLISVVSLSSAVETDPEAIEVSHNFMKGFMNAIKSGDLFKVLAIFSPQSGTTNINASKLIQDLNGLRVSFRGAHFVDNNKNEVAISAIFRAPKSEKAAKSADFVIEFNTVEKKWTIKSMTDLVTETGAPKAFKRTMFPPTVIG